MIFKVRGSSAFQASRRWWLTHAGVLVSSAAFPFRLSDALAQAESSLNALPRVALVIGNTRYAEAPLKNPANDARAMGAALQKLGFNVDVKLEARRDEMVEAIRAYGSELGKRKSIGLFYYAGHGAQLAWRNYLIPVDVRIRNVSEMQSQALDVSALLKNLTLARNPMNVIILDACRDNPLGADVQVEQKGLSQIDAPPGTLLAYATAPGNVAADGAGENGLYTQHLLKEMLAPAEKIEDVFKRVRLNVRRQSQGQQIPWESTSLEEDFYFQPPRQLRKATEQERDRKFEEELAIWERIKDAKAPAQLEDYLRKYPSGVFSEVAQLRLDRVLAQSGEKRIEIRSAADNPFSKGTGRLNIRFKVGDRFQYRESDLDTKKEIRTYTLRVTGISDDEVSFNEGLLSSDLLGNPRKQSDGDQQTQSQYYIPEYSVGKKWTTRYKLLKLDGRTFNGEYEFKVLGRDKITVPAGTFDAFHVEGNGRGEEAGSTLYLAYWMTPEIGRFIVRDYKRYSKARKVTNNHRTELLSYRQT